MPATNVRSHFQRDLFPGLDMHIDIGYGKEFPKAYTQLFRVERSDKAFEEFRTMAGTGLFVKTGENVEPSSDRFFDGYPKRFNHDDYTSKIGFSHQFMHDVKTRSAFDRATDLGKSARATEELLHAAIFNNSVVTLGPDAKALCATDHPNIRGGTQSNLLTPAATLSIPSIRSMLTMGRRYFDDTGVRRLPKKFKWLVVPPELEFEAEEILKSAGRPDTMNRADNIMRNRLTAYIHEWLDSTTSFYVLTEKQEHYIFVFIREAFKTRTYYDDKTRANYVEGSFANSNGWGHWIGIIRSNPV